MLAHVPSFGRKPRGSPDFLAYPVPKACMHALGTRVPRRLGVANSASSPKAALALGCSLTPGLRISFGQVTCMARAASVPGLWALGFLPIPHCANSVLYVDYTEMPKFRGYDFALVVTCGLTRFTRVFPCTKHITGEETIKILLEEWFCVYGAPKEINSDEDVQVSSDTGWYKRFLRSLNVQVSTGIPYSHTSNPLCERQIRVLKENVRIWCKTERTRDWVRLLPVISLMMNSQETSATGYSPHELFLGRHAWFLHAPYPEDTHSSVGEWVQEQQAKVDKAKAMLQRVRERQWNKKNKHRVPATYQEGDWVLVDHSRLPA